MLFFDAFPLQGSDSSAVESDVILQKQFDLLSSLLKDADHRVRAAAASGVCHILREYWEALPTQTTRQILSYVVGTLGHDSNCAVVRLAVVKGLGEVLDQPLSHSVLKSLLPLISDALHDKSLAVRVAFIEILKKVTFAESISCFIRLRLVVRCCHFLRLLLLVTRCVCRRVSSSALSQCNSTTIN
jgi:condensin-2 complex subunit G2